MNDFDPFTSPRSYSKPFNPTWSFDYAAAKENHHPSVRRGILLLGLSIAALIIIGASMAFAQDEQQADIATLEGQTIGINAVICLDRNDANTVLSHIEHGGVKEAAPYLSAPDNSCFLDHYTVVVGSVLATANAPDGKAWNIVAAASADGSVSAFMVTAKLLSAARDTATESNT